MISTQQQQNRLHGGLGRAAREQSGETKQVTELLVQAVETGRRGEQIYRYAMMAAPDGELFEEWQQFADDAKAHEQVLLGVLEQLKLDPEATSPGRTLVTLQGESLLKALQAGLNSATPDGAQAIARECVAIAHTQALLSWYWMGNIATEVAGSTGQALQGAFAELERIRTNASKRHGLRVAPD